MHVIPHLRTQDSVTLWIQAEKWETGWGLSVVGPTLAEPRTWSPEASTPQLLPNVTPGPRRRIWRWTVDDLVAGAEFEVRYTGDIGTDDPLAASFRTIPDSLERPFTVLLGSCYSEDSDLSAELLSRAVRASAQQPALRPVHALVQAVRHVVVGIQGLLRTGPAGSDPRGHVDQRYQDLFASGDRPDLKLLVGDQVYLDAPWFKYFGLPLPWTTPTRHISAVYKRTWDKLHWMLSHGITVCVSDDHEFWNDYPYPPPIVTVFTKFLVGPFRRRWNRRARQFLRAFQAPQDTMAISIGGDRPEVQFFVADTRLHRRSGGPSPTLMRETDFQDLLSWIAELRAPGVLAIGQPVFAEPVNERFGVVTDHNLPFFAGQYDRLCAALLAAPHDVLILSGDVHFGRVVEVAVTRIRPDPAARIVEVISSPMALVRGGASHFDPARQHRGQRFPTAWSPRFPPGAVPDLPEPPVVRSVDWVTRSDGHWPDHVTTLRFTRGDAPGRVHVDVLAHSLEPGADSTTAPLMETSFVLDRHGGGPTAGT
jgi:hypothetical protein